MANFVIETFPNANPGGAPTSTPSPSLIIQQTFPSLTLTGTESGGQSAIFTELDGDLWITTNAFFNGSSWIGINVSQPATAIVQRGSSNTINYYYNAAPLSINGVISWQPAASLTTPGYVALLNGIVLQWGSVSVASDGSALSSPVFSYPYTTSCFSVVLTPQFSYSTNPYAITYGLNAVPSKTGFTCWAAGGQGSVTLMYQAVGL